MSYSYEELRTAAFDVLAGRVKSQYTPNQFGHLKIGVAKALEERGLQPPQPHSIYPADTALDGADASTLLEVFWDFFVQGIITLGIDDPNPEFPWFHLTRLGERIVKGENAYFVHDVSGYEKRITAEIPKPGFPRLA